MTLSQTHAETKTELAKNFDEIRDDMGKKTRECDVIRAKDSKLEKGLASLRVAPEANKKKNPGLESQVTLDTKANARLAMLVEDHRSTCLCVTPENDEL